MLFEPRFFQRVFHEAVNYNTLYVYIYLLVIRLPSGIIRLYNIQQYGNVRIVGRYFT